MFLILLIILFIMLLILKKPSNIISDVSMLNPSQVIQIFKPVSINEIKHIVLEANRLKIPIVSRGQTHSMGGQSIIAKGYAIDMSLIKFIKNINPKTVWIGAGATWADLIYKLNFYKLSPTVLQSYCTFSVGGSISVNSHGITSNETIASTILEIMIITPDGNLFQCKPENKLFGLIIGGYGLFGIIIAVKLKIVPNHSLTMNPVVECTTNDFIEKYNKVCLDTSIEVKIARINILTMQDISLYTFSKDNHTLVSKINSKPHEMSKISQLLYKWIMPTDAAQKVRYKVERKIKKPIDFPETKTSRNVLLYESATPLTYLYSPLINLRKTHILQEYFITNKHFIEWMHFLKKIFVDDAYHKLLGIILLNITIRYVVKDKITFLPYATHDMFAFVFYYRIDCTTVMDNKLQKLHDLLVNKILELNGTFYLPYRLHYSKEQLMNAYPNIDDFFELKRQYDPNGIFQNMWYQKYH